MSYRNITYNLFKGEIVLFTWDSCGNRITQIHPFKPYFYIDDTSSKDGVSMYNTPLKKLEFEDTSKRKDYEKSFPRTYYNIAPEQQFLIEKYLGLNKTDKFKEHQLKTYYIDIEVLADEFPKATEANHPINLISVLDSITNTVHVFGLGNEYYGNKYDNVIYKSFATEKDLLKGFLRFWRKDFPDIVSGWFIDGFDLPYICNRLINVFENKKAPNKLSPVDRTYMKEHVKKRLDLYDQIWTIQGVTTFDYQYVYKVFTQKNRESYALDFIAETELNEGKLKHDAVSLSKLSKENWDTFVDYNVQDVLLVQKLEKKLKYLELCRSLAYAGLSPLSYAVSTVGIVTGVAAQKALEKGKIISTFGKSVVKNYSGGFVKESQQGLSKSILYFDANSLYPNTIVTLNISPETKLGSYFEEAGIVKVITTKGKEFNIESNKFKEFCKTEKICLSKYGIMFSQKERGIFPDIIEEWYAKRVAIKKELKTLNKQLKFLNDFKGGNIEDINRRKREIELKIKQFDIEQYTIKIFLNRIYGYFGQEFCPMYDIDIAASVTCTGQHCIRTAASLVTNHITNKYGINYDPIVASDTDSIMITIDPILQQQNINFLDSSNKITPDVYKIAEEFKNVIDVGINDMAQNELMSIHSTYEFKRENISYAGIFLAKKYYILNIMDEDDIPKDEFLYKGVQVVKIATPKKVKPLIKNVIEKVIKSGDMNVVQNVLDEAYVEFQKLSLEDIASPIGLNNYTKYYNQIEKLDDGKLKFYRSTPRQVRAAIYYNTFLERFNLTNKYEKLTNGNKMKIFYTLPNQYDIDSMVINYKFPEELKEVFKLDYKKMFEKLVFTPVKSVFESINWDMNNPLKEEKTNLLNLFG